MYWKIKRFFQMWKYLFNHQLMFVKTDTEDDVNDDINHLGNNQLLVEADSHIDNGNFVY